jgi:3-oxoacyl-[acyl-carrier protein] reductase
MSDSPGQPVALITGASRGLGAALVEEFLSAHWQVVAGHRSSAATNYTPGTPGPLMVVPLDVTQRDQVEEAFENVVARFGRVDALINNAGVTADEPCGQMSEEDWQHVLDVNLRGAFLCSRAASRHMVRQRDGHIINISSYAGRAGARGQANYAAAKAGLFGLTQSLAKELGLRNVRVNAILPGVLPTKMTAQITSEQLGAFANANVLGRINALDEVARFIAFLATTRNISGQLFQLDSRIARWT